MVSTGLKVWHVSIIFLSIFEHGKRCCMRLMKSPFESKHIEKETWKYLESMEADEFDVIVVIMMMKLLYYPTYIIKPNSGFFLISILKNLVWLRNILILLWFISEKHLRTQQFNFKRQSSEIISNTFNHLFNICVLSGSHVDYALRLYFHLIF